MDQLFALNDVVPLFQVRDPPPPIIRSTKQDLEDLYRFHFAQGLDKLFETTWFTSRGSAHLLQDPLLLDFALQCEEEFKNQDSAAAKQVRSLEARLVWKFATMPRTSSLTGGAKSAIDDELTNELLPRIDTVEHLLTAQFLPQVKMPAPPAQSHPAVHNTKYIEQNFWYQLGRFCSVRDDGSESNTTHEIEDSLAVMRGILGMMENRDVLYSLAVGRHIGGRSPDFQPHHAMLAPNDPTDDLSKLEVARRFVEDEDTKGTSQVIQRVCSMAMRSWVLQKQ